LTDLGADLEIRNKYGATAVFAACEKGYYTILKKLVTSGADPEICNNNSTSPISVAAFKGHVSFLFMLLL